MNQAQMTAMYIAQAVRNAMEDFHADNLSDDQMRQLNPIIRDAIYTALYAIEQSAQGSDKARLFVAFNHQWPDYWEPPSLLEDYTKSDFEPETIKQVLGLLGAVDDEP